MTTLLPHDADGRAIDALRLSPGYAQTLNVTSVTARSVAFKSDTLVISVFATTNCFIRTGDIGVVATATDHFLPAGFYITLSLKKDAYLAVIRATADGAIYISELE